MKTKTNILAAGIFLAAVASGSAQTTFTKITTGNIVTDVGAFTRSAWGDFNGDGFLDLFVSNHGGRRNVFYRNNGNGTFTKISLGDPVQDDDYHTGATAADYDNDGHLDLLVSAGVGTPTARRNMLYHNNGDGAFSRVSGGSVTNQLGFFNACTWADYDNDGFLDFFVTDSGPLDDSGGTNLLFHNNGDGTFAKVTSGPLASGVGTGSGALWSDYDSDGFMDLIVINWVNPGQNFLYRNNGDGTFTQILTNPIATDSWPSGASGGAWGDYDNDGLPDLFVTDGGGVSNHLYHNNGGGDFTNVTSGPMLQPASSAGAHASIWGDYDNDGYLDLFVSGNNGLYHNNGDGTFAQILSEPPVNGETPGTGTFSVAWADYDNDGFLDLFVTRIADAPVSNLLFHNDGNTNGWLEVKLVGIASNRSAIGTKVRLHATIGGKTFWQLREISTGGGWNVQPLVAHFGLGDATNVDEVRIEWPSGIVQTLANVGLKQILTVVEHQQAGPPSRPVFTSVSPVADGSVNLSVTGDAGPLYVFESSPDLATWTKVGVRSNATGIVAFTDTKATNYTRGFYRVSIP